MKSYVISGLRRCRRLIVVTGTAGAMSMGLFACGETASGGAGDVASSCKPAHEFKTVKDGTLIVAVSPYMPAANVVNGKLIGIDSDLVTQFAKTECLKVKAILSTTAGTIPLVQSGRADVAIGDWYRTKERQKVVDISDPTYLDAIAIASYEGYETLDDLKNVKSGDVQGNAWNEDFKRILGSNYRLYSNAQQESADLVNKRVQAAITGPLYWSYQTHTKPLKGVQLKIMKADSAVPTTENQPQSGIPYTKGNEALGEALNAGIKQMKSDGFLKKVFGKYGTPTELLNTGPPRFL